MENFLELLRLALDRGWTLGALLAIFFGIILFGATHGLPVPTPLREWCAAGMLFVLAIVRTLKRLLLFRIVLVLPERKRASLFRLRPRVKDRTPVFKTKDSADSDGSTDSRFNLYYKSTTID